MTRPTETSRRALILSTLGDLHTQWVSAALPSHGGTAVCFDMRRYPGIGQTIACGRETRLTDQTGLKLVADEPFDAVWVRRPGRAGEDTTDVHPDDLEYIKVLHEIYDHEVWSVINHIAAGPHTVWINPPSGSSRASAKVLQLRLADRLGLAVPPTLISNVVDDVRAFAINHAPLICKSFAPKLWNDDGIFSKALTNVVDPFDESIAASIALQPAIYQPLVEKDYELRILVLDDQIFAIRIDSQSDADFRLDWRRRPLPRNMVTPFEVPGDLAAKLVMMMRELGIVMGSFDFIVDRHGANWFLEVNEAGQFLFLEDHCPDLPILDAFCHLLVSGSLADWNRSSPLVRLEHVKRDGSTTLSAADEQ